MKFALFSAALLAGSASAFSPAQQGSRAATSLNAEMSKSLPFMKRPALVSRPNDVVALEPLCSVLQQEIAFFVEENVLTCFYISCVHV